MIIAIPEAKDYSKEALETYQSIGDVFESCIPEDVDILVTRLKKYPLNLFPDLKVIASPTTGLDHIDLDGCKERGIEVISLQGETEFLKGITSTAEHTIGLMIAVSRNYKSAFDNPTWSREKHKGHRLAGKTLGIIGYGRVGLQVSSRAQALGMQIAVTAGDMLEPLDYLTLHIPLEGNKGFFTKEMFKQMKPTAYFINTSRDEIVEKGALLWALENGEIAGAAVDFVDDKELLEYSGSNLVLVNHLGGATIEDMQATEILIAQRVKEYLIAKVK